MCIQIYAVFIMILVILKACFSTSNVSCITCQTDGISSTALTSECQGHQILDNPLNDLEWHFVSDAVKRKTLIHCIVYISVHIPGIWIEKLSSSFPKRNVLFSTFFFFFFFYWVTILKTNSFLSHLVLQEFRSKTTCNEPTLTMIWAASRQNDCALSNVSDQPGHPPSLISLRCPHEETLGPQLPTERKAKTDQTERMPRLISLHWAHTHFVGFYMRRLIFVLICHFLFCQRRGPFSVYVIC